MEQSDSGKKEKVCYAEDLPLKPNQIAICYFCERIVTEDDYCYGCKHFVCQDCDQTNVLGSHDVDEHEEVEDE